MKLYLSSYRIPTPHDLIDLIGKKPNQTRVALIPNAKDYLADRAWNFKTGEAVQYFEKLGLRSTDIVDLRKYNNTSDLEFVLSKYDLIWANGGNTFCLLYEMKRTKFNTVIKKLSKEGIVYGGESAGALVAGITIKGSELADQPEFSEEVFWEGLQLTDNVVIPHVDNPMFQESLKPMIEMYKTDKSAIFLNDNQAYIVDGDKTRIVTGS